MFKKFKNKIFVYIKFKRKTKIQNINTNDISFYRFIVFINKRIYKFCKKSKNFFNDKYTKKKRLKKTFSISNQKLQMSFANSFWYFFDFVKKTISKNNVKTLFAFIINKYRYFDNKIFNIFKNAFVFKIGKNDVSKHFEKKDRKKNRIKIGIELFFIESFCN